ncbi:hypothetical protein [Ochrovirga pacifica]|uniref:hypothetical protein n=1 Tax=Ochrovirga pacifica TaxID=1042376 RepID=UPI0002557756|nr:hypothetical protein [Ochrovirga pacifica]
MKKFFSLFSLLMALAITNVSCSDDSNEVTVSSLANINQFTVDIQDLTDEEINYDYGTDITISVPFGTDLTTVIPTITLSDNATVSPASGETITFVDGVAQNFVVTAEDGTTTKTYTVTINVRAEVGSGTRLKTYVLADLYGENSTTTYTYNDANFVSTISKEVDDWGTISTTTYTLVYNDKNQVIEKTAEGQSTVYTYEEGKIVKATYTADDVLTYTYNYTYDLNGNLASETRTDHTNSDATSQVLFTIVEGNVTVENRFGDDYTAEYDDKKNPFKELYPAAYAAINVGISAVNTNNPISGTLADDSITYEYNTEGYPVSASYTYFDGLATVDKTFTYFED